MHRAPQLCGGLTSQSTHLRLQFTDTSGRGQVWCWVCLSLCGLAGCPIPDTCEQKLRADMWKLEMENASLRRELDSVRRVEESCRAQLNELHEAYFSLQQCLGRRVHKLQVSGCHPGGWPV